jgi:hypothetical protein
MTEKEILTLWSEIITQYGLQTTIDLISNSPKILSPWRRPNIKRWSPKILVS